MLVSCIQLVLLVLTLSAAQVFCNLYPIYVGPTSASIREDEPAGSQVISFRVSDPEDDPLTVTINLDGQFHLNPSQNEPGNYDVTLKEQLDRERESKYSLVISIVDGSGNSISQEVRIRVLDYNDYTPIFEHQPLMAHVREDAEPGTFVLNLTAKDEDTGYNSALEVFIVNPGSVPFYLGNFTTKEPKEHNYLGADAATVLLKRRLDYELTSVIKVNVQVTDMAACPEGSSICQEPLMSEQTLTVNVVDVQDTPPRFFGAPYQANTEENLPIGSHIVSVQAVDGDTSNQRPVQYYILNDDGALSNATGLFAINTSTGQISNRVLIDSDSTLKQSGLSYTMTVVAIEKPSKGDTADPSTDRSTTTVTITILDLNDEKPTFSSNQAVGTVGEELPAGSIVTLNQALRVEDRDQLSPILKGQNGSYSLRALNEDDTVSSWFSVSPANAVNSVLVTLTTKQSIDFEDQQMLIVKLEATEVSTGYSTSCLVTVYVTDSNDNSPKLSQKVYNGSVPENALPGDIVNMITAINATDPDSDSLGQVTFSLRDADDVFDIDSRTGEVFVVCETCLDRESRSLFYLTVLARDGGGLADSAQLVIQVLDVNDHPPTFTSQSYQCTVDEGSTVIYPPVTVEAMDLDTGVNRQVTYTVDTYSDYVGVHMNGSVYLKQALNAEMFESELEVNITATDHGLPSLSSTVLLRLIIKDLNDNAPQFANSTVHIEIAEDSMIGQVVFKVHATDKDRTSPNNLITYTLESGALGLFTIDPESGEVKVKQSLDRDMSPDVYSLVISAIDKGTPALASQLTLTIRLTDVNDERPVFTQNPYMFNVRENSPAGTPVGLVKANDADLNHLIHYSITDVAGYGSNRNRVEVSVDLLAIDTTSGNITTTQAMDRELIARLVVTVLAVDINGVKKQNDSTLVEISVLDENDNPPEIRPVGTLEIVESATLYRPLLLTKLTVIDSDQEGQLEFSISNNPNAAFNINDNGELYQVKAVDREATSGAWMNITIVVQDGGDNPLSSSIEIPVFVKDVNDNAPTFRVFETLVAVEEDRAIGSNVTRVLAVDADADPGNADIQYRIISGAQDKVAMNRNTGLITVTGDLDRDSQQQANTSLHLIIEACDYGVPKMCNSKTMTIRITDVNDNSPVFTRHLYSATVKEIAKTGDVLYMDGGVQVKAEDIDAAPNGQNVEYTCCSPGNDTAGLFSVTSQGQVVVAAVPGLSGLTGIYKLTVRASDWGNPRRYGEAVVMVTVQDYNDHKPVLTVISHSGSANIHKPEDSPIGSDIVMVEASDADIGDNAVVDIFFLTDISQLSDYQYFYIVRDEATPNRVTIKQNTTFDRESKAKRYQLGLIGRDRGSPTLDSSTLMITVNVDDINDNMPYFLPDKQRVDVTVQEETYGVVVATVNDAQDQDERNIFCYYISGARDAVSSDAPAHESQIQQLFTIDPSTAEVKLRSGQKLDHESQSMYVLVITADDTDANVYGGCQFPPNKPWAHKRAQPNEMELVIHVEDINDSSPRFSKDEYTFAVVRGNAPPVSICKLQNYVTDPDVDDEVVFSMGDGFKYSSQDLADSIHNNEPIKVFSDGEAKTDVTFTEPMSGFLEFGVIATDLVGHSAQAKVKVLIISSEHTAIFTVSKELKVVEKTSEEFTRLFKVHTNWTVTIVSLSQSKQAKYYTDIALYVIPSADSMLTGDDILTQTAGNTELMDALHRYGLVDRQQTGQAVADDQEPSAVSKTVIFIVVAIVLVVVVVLVLALCYIMRIKYKRKLKAAHAMAFDTHTLGYDIDPESVTQPIGHDDMSANHRHSDDSGTSPVWDKAPSLNNFDYGNSNTAFERHKFFRQSRESHRSTNSADDNVIDPLNREETQSCSSAGSNDWRLDVRGNNLGCSPPPPITDETIDIILSGGHNQLGCDRKFTDSLSSDKSSSDNTTKGVALPVTDHVGGGGGHFNRLIMSDSVYGKIYETRRMPNGLETTEV